MVGSAPPFHRLDHSPSMPLLGPKSLVLGPRSLALPHGLALSSSVDPSRPERVVARAAEADSNDIDLAVSAAAVPYRPAHGVHVVVGPGVPGAELVHHPGVAGAWQFFDAERDRTITVTFVDGDLWQAAAAIGTGGSESAEWAGPLERVDAFRWDWFATLTPQ